MSRRGRACLTLAVTTCAVWSLAASHSKPMTPAGLFVAATPIEPPDGDKYWLFHVVNDSSESIQSIVLEEVCYEWGDHSTCKDVHTRFGALPPGKSVEIWRETTTELRTSVMLVVRGDKGERRIAPESPALYSPETMKRRMVDIPILRRRGLIAR